MGNIFKKPKKPTPPPAPPPPPPPEPLPAPAAVKETGGEAEISKARRRRGFQSTIITGALVPASTGKKKVFG